MSILNLDSFDSVFNRYHTASATQLSIEHSIDESTIKINYNLVLDYPYYEIVVPCFTNLNLRKLLAVDEAESVQLADNKGYIKLLSQIVPLAEVRKSEGETAIHVKDGEAEQQVIEELEAFIHEPFESFMGYETSLFEGQKNEVARAVNANTLEYAEDYRTAVIKEAINVLQGETTHSIKLTKIIRQKS